MFRQDFSCPVLLKNYSVFYLYGAITHYGPTFQTVLVVTQQSLGWSAFARHY